MLWQEWSQQGLNAMGKLVADIIVETLQSIDANGQRRIFASLLHGSMANGMPSAIGLQKAEPGRQVVCMAGDGEISMLFGDLMTVVQQELPIKIAVYDNGKLGFVEIEKG
jgi:pyruvate dehydrogenase (quinone)